jgi:AsmA-like C-terminal region
MAWHKWFVRGVVFSIFAAAVLGALAYQHWTNPIAVGNQVLAKLGAYFPGAAVSIDSASLEFLGYIKVHELHLASRDTAAEVAHIPSAILYHDKEKLLDDGHLSFRKIELHRPRLRVIREADGSWNIQGLRFVGQPEQPVPTIVVHQATVQFEDRRVAAAPLKMELTGAHLTLINDPLDTVTLDGSAHAELLGKIVVHGTWQREAKEFALAIKTQDTPLNDALLGRFACLIPTEKLKSAHIEGRANLHVNVGYRSSVEPAWSYDVHCQVSNTTVRHPDLPLPFENLQAGIHFDGSDLRVEKLRAQAGAAMVTANGVGRLPGLEKNFEADLRIHHVLMDEELSKHFPEKVQTVLNNFKPRGRATLQAALCRRDGQWTALRDGTASRVTILPEDITACFEKFPRPLDKITGAIHCTLPQRRFHVDLIGYAGARPVSIQGDWQGEGAHVDMQFDVAATDVVIDPALIAALPEPVRTTAQSFHSSGKVDVQAKIRRRPSDDKFDGEYHIRVHDGAIAWDDCPLLLRDVSCFLDVYCPTAWVLRDFQGTHGAGKVIVQGRAAEPDERHARPGVYLEMTGTNLALDADLRAALRPMPALAKAFDTLQPSGQLNFTAAIDRRGKQPEDLEVRVDVKGPTVQPEFFRYPLHEIAGHFHLQDQRLEMRRLSAQHGDARWYLDQGSVLLHAGGALYADLPDLQVERIAFDQDLLAALPPKLRDSAAALHFRNPLRLKTRLVVAHSGTPGAAPDVFWDGQLWLRDAAFHVGVDVTRVTGTVACTGRHDGQQLQGLQGNIILERAAAFNQPFHDIQSRFYVTESHPTLLHCDDFKATIFGGDIAGQLTLDCQELPPRYELNLTASQIDLKDFGKYNLGNSKLTGVAVARLHLAGAGLDADTLDGHGTLDVPNGKLYDLPFLLDLIKFLGLRWPDRTMFEELHAQFAIRRRRAYVRHLELFGNAVSFTGQGEINLDGTDLHMDMYPSWARIEQLLPPAVRAMPPALSKNLLTVEARGKITGDSKDIKFTRKPVPMIVDPLLHLRDILVGPQLDLRRPPEMNQRVETLYRAPE